MAIHCMVNTKSGSTGKHYSSHGVISAYGLAKRNGHLFSMWTFKDNSWTVCGFPALVLSVCFIVMDHNPFALNDD